MKEIHAGPSFRLSPPSFCLYLVTRKQVGKVRNQEADKYADSCWFAKKKLPLTSADKVIYFPHQVGTRGRTLGRRIEI